MALNPDCTPGQAEYELDGTVTWYCGCGESGSGFPSRRQALRAQKEHRFPGPNPKEEEEQQQSA